MSIWRTKRRHEENRRFNEQADAALLAIGVLKNRDEGIKLAHDDDVLKSQLRKGQALLSSLLRGLKSPEDVDDYTYALAQQFCDSRRQVPEGVITQLEQEIGTLERSEERLEAVEGIDYVEATLSDVEELAGKVSESEAEQLRGKLVG